MLGRRINPLRPVLQSLAVLILFAGSGTSAQERQACPERSGYAQLRLAQVAPRDKIINLYASAQDWCHKPGWPPSPRLEALVGPNRIEIKGDREAAGGVAFVFLVDISGSLSQRQFQAVRESLDKWIDDGLGPDDLAAIVTFGKEVNISRPKDKPEFIFSSERDTLRKLIPSRAGDPDTKLYQGLVQAIDLAKRIDIAPTGRAPIRRAIVVLTDGRDDQQGGAGRQEVVDKLAVDPVPIYGIGAAAKGNSAVNQALKDFSALVRVSGGEYVRIETSVRNISDAYSDLKEIIKKVRHLEAECAPCAADGSAVPVRLTMSGPAETLESQTVTVRMVDASGKVPPPPTRPIVSPPISTPQPKITIDPPEPWWRVAVRVIVDLKTPLLWAIGLVALASLGIAGTLAMLKKRRIETRSPPVVTRPPGAPPRTTSGDVAVLSSLVVTPATSPHTQRLRLYPLGQNDLAPIDVQFERKLLVGRSPDSEICIGNDGQVSAKHCTLAPDGKFILVQDNQSRNGTRINGVPINGAMHAEADAILGVGRTDLRIRLLPAGVR